jgi:hypothetical protein
MLNWIKNLFTGTTVPETPFQDFSDIGIAQRPIAPYKVPAPAETTPVPLVAEKAVEAVVKSVAKPKATATKKAAPKTASKKPAAIKAEPAKRGRKPKSAAGA